MLAVVSFITNEACTTKNALHSVHWTGAGLCPHFRESSPNNAFGVWWLSQPNPSLSGNACRWGVNVVMPLLLYHNQIIKRRK
jgi:hypothetical protein